MKRLALLLLCAAALAGCATPPAALPAPEALFRDASFAPPAQRIDADEVFALSDAMKRYVHVEIARQLRSEGLTRGLVNALYRRDQLKLEYDASMTRNAAQAFDARRGNCLSLVIMTAAFAKELGLQVSYQTVLNEDTWSRVDDIAFLNRHVNLTLSTPRANAWWTYDPNQMLTIDFLPAEYILGQRTRTISEDTVIAMYMNNRAAEALSRGRLDDAYWWARGAIVRAPAFSSSYNTLGVIYLRRSDPQAAVAVLERLLAREPKDKEALSNLATALDKLGRGGESAALRTRLAQLEPYPPYYFFQLGTAAMKRGDYQAAKSMFAKEVDRADYSGEFHFWLGVANLGLGDVNEARRQIAIAVENSTTNTEHELYTAKLDRLRSLGVR